MIEPVTHLLRASQDGDRSAREQLYEALYPGLRSLARQRLRGSRPGDTLDTSALVHEAFFRLAGYEADLSDTKHLVAVAVTAMRQIVIDHARERLTEKRGVGRRPMPLDDERGVALAADADAEALLKLDAALEGLQQRDPRLAKVVELRYFGGLSVDEVADVLGVSTPTVKRDSRVARSVLLAEMAAGA